MYYNADRNRGSEKEGGYWISQEYADASLLDERLSQRLPRTWFQMLQGASKLEKISESCRHEELLHVRDKGRKYHIMQRASLKENVLD